MATGFTPVYQIMKDGLDITGHFNDRCVQIRIDCSGDMDTATFVIDDRDWLVARPNVGDVVKISLGYVEVGMAYMGSFEIDEVVFTGVPKAIQIKASSQGQHSLLKSHVTMNLQGKTLQEITGILADKGQLSAQVNPSIGNITVPFLNMTQSPQQLMNELKRRYGLVMKAVDGKLVATPVDSGESASGTSMPTLVLTQEHFGTWSVRHTSRAAYSHVIASYVDENHVTQHEQAQMPPAEGVTNLPYVIERKFNSKDEAQAAAKGQSQAMQRSLGDADLQLAKGDPWIQGQQRILIRGMRDGVNGSYVADLVSHTYVKDQGILTSIKARPDSNGEDYESLFNQATPDQLRQQFLVPGAAGLMGSLFTLGGGDASRAGANGATTNDLLNGVNPFGP